MTTTQHTWNADQAPDARPGHYYVTAIDGPKKYAIAGKFWSFMDNAYMGGEAIAHKVAAAAAAN